MTHVVMDQIDDEVTSNPLPKGWTWTTIGAVAVTSSGGTPSRDRDDYFGGTIPWVKSGELKDQVISDVEEYLTETGMVNSSAKIFPSGTPLVALYGATVGKTGLLAIDAATNQAVCAILNEYKAWDAKYLMYWLRSQRSELIGLSAGGAQRNISQGIIKAYPFPLAPLAEQKRIVDVIEAQFTRLDAAVAGLRRLRANLQRYRQSVLKAACEGRLVATEAELARTEDRPFEDGATLLQRVLAERRRQWEADNRPQQPKDDKWKAKYREPAAPDVSSLPDLPDGWSWATVEQLASARPYSLVIGPFGSNLKVSDYTESGVPLVFVRNIRSGVFDGDDTRYVSHVKAMELSGHQVMAGDILITKMGEPPGDARLYPLSAPPAIITADCIKFAPSDLLPGRTFFVHAINSDVVAPQVDAITQGVAQRKVSLGRFRKISLPLPPLAEQKRIVEEVERRLSVIEQHEQVIAASLKRAERLRQSILKRAFAGQL